VIVFSIYENEQNHCSDEQMGIYYAPVPNFMEGYLENIQQAKADQGYDDWEVPDVAQYIECTAFEIENTIFYMQLGCADGTSQALAVNIYTDNTCTNRSIVEGYDDSNIDVSALKVRAIVSFPALPMMGDFGILSALCEANASNSKFANTFLFSP
jgi:hypothetical protein